MKIDWRDPRVGWFIVIGGPLVLLVALAGGAWITRIVNSRPIAFDAELWVECAQRNHQQFGAPTPRQRMLGELTSTHLRTEMPRRALTSLLGPPTAERVQGVLVWQLGELRSKHIECLVVRLDEAGEHVTGWTIEAMWML